MNKPKCLICASPVIKNGRTAAGKQRWKCKACSITQTNLINSDVKHLEQLLSWLLSRTRQADMVGLGRTFRRKSQKFWKIWALPPLIDEIHKVVYVDEIHLGRKAVVLIAASSEYVFRVVYCTARTCRSIGKSFTKNCSI